MAESLPNDQQSSLADVAAGDVSPSEAARLFKQVYSEQPEGFGEKAYLACKALALTIVSGRRHDQLGDWVDLMNQTAALARHTGTPEMGFRVLAISDLIADWRRHTIVHSDAVIMERPHVVRILEVIKSHGGHAQRRVIRDETEIGEANLSRILGHLEANGLISRSGGRERSVSLTAEATKRLEPAEEGQTRVGRVFRARMRREGRQRYAKGTLLGKQYGERPDKKAKPAKKATKASGSVLSLSFGDPDVQDLSSKTKEILKEHASSAALLGSR